MRLIISSIALINLINFINLINLWYPHIFFVL